MKRITTSPHLHSGFSTRNIMLCVAYALTPAWIWGVLAFGFRAFLVMLVSISSAVLTEYLLGLINKEETIRDGSALVTGMLIGMNMSPAVPLFIPVIASVFAIAVVKWTFGGLGANWANPAIAGRVFVFFSFTNAMSEFTMPAALRGAAELVGAATPLSFVKTAVVSGNYPGATSLNILAMNGYPVSNLAMKLSQTTGFNPYNIDAFIGNIPGCIGEVSSLLLLLGGIYLICKDIITWHIPVTFILSYSVLTWIFGGMPNGLGAFHGEVTASVLRGGLILGAFFMATDYVTTPITHKGMIIFAAGCGFFTFLFRTFGSLPEATSVAILIMNITVPTIDRFCKPKKFGETVVQEVAK